MNLMTFFKALSSLNTLILEDCNNYINSLEFLIITLLKKIEIIILDLKNDINKLTTNVNILDKVLILNIIKNNNDILNYLYLVENDLSEYKNSCIKIDNYLNETNIPELENQNIILVICDYLKLIVLNSNKINELFNLVKLLNCNSNEIKYVNVIKNDYIYNTTYYESLLNIFNFNTLLDNIKTLIKFRSATNTNNFNSIISYNTLSTENIYSYIAQTKLFFNNINDQIIETYNNIFNFDSTIDKLDLTNNDNIANFNYNLSQLKYYSKLLFDTINKNNINLYIAYDVAYNFLNEFIINVEEYIFYVQIFNDFTALQNYSNIVMQDILSIFNITIDINTDNTNNNLVFNDSIKTQTLNEFYSLIYNGIISKQYIFYNNIIYYDDLNILMKDSTGIYNFSSELITIITNFNNYRTIIYNNYSSSNSNLAKNAINFSYISLILKYIAICNYEKY
jgi:hypothetical protein